MLDHILAFVWAFVIAVFAIPSIIRVAHQKNLLDEPNFRTVHISLTPRLGGLAIFAGFMSALTIFGKVTPDIQTVMAGCMILFFIGLKDDIVTISAFKKFFVQVLATGIVMFMGDIRLTSFQGFAGIHELDPGTSYGITFLAIIGITNAINLIDGLDGLAGMIITIASCTFGAYFFMYGGEVYGGYAYVAFCLAGAVMGFLRYNGHKAIIFMGDTGSLVCGFLISIMAIQFIEMNATSVAPSLAVGVLIIPLFDTIRVFGLRMLRGISPFTPDKNHIHHILLSMGLSQLGTIGVLGIVNLLVISAMMFFEPVGNNVLMSGVIMVAFAITLLLEAYTQRKKKLIKQ